MTSAVMGSVVPEKAGQASGVISSTRQIGSVLGIAVMGAVLQNRALTYIKEGVGAKLDSAPVALPDAAKKRTYPVQVHDRGDRGLVVLVVNSYEIMVGMANEPGFIGRRNGDSVRFDVTDDMLADFAMIERIPGVGDMGYVGTGTGTIDSAGRIVATFDGEFRIGYGSPSPMTCRASDHRMEFAPAGK